MPGALGRRGVDGYHGSEKIKLMKLLSHIHVDALAYNRGGDRNLFFTGFDS
jgi:hypothetical protein